MDLPTNTLRTIISSFILFATTLGAMVGITFLLLATLSYAIGTLLS